MEEITKKILNENGIENFEELVKKYEKMVYGIAYRSLNNKQDAEDITQETFLIIYKKIKDLKKYNSLTNWIYTIALNLTREYMRKNYSKKNLYHILESTLNIKNENNDSNYLKEILKEKIKSSLEKLSSQQKEAIELKYLKDLKIKEISKIMNCKEGTVKVHLFRGIRALKEVLKNEK
ncbi:MAG TPA: RNA polymerase sigma factor [bacterium]|nr:RNA polymerase sigma factor [bacterium]HOM26425.1 RNA polymerase sigma factor [bacterium]